MIGRLRSRKQPHPYNVNLNPSYETFRVSTQDLKILDKDFPLFAGTPRISANVSDPGNVRPVSAQIHMVPTSPVLSLQVNEGAQVIASGRFTKWHKGLAPLGFSAPGIYIGYQIIASHFRHLPENCGLTLSIRTSLLPSAPL
jgi:hypothetical protein